MNFYLRWLQEMAKLKGLGKGLDALLSAADAPLGVLTANHKDSELYNIDLDKIQPGKYQPRHNFNHAELEELAASIKANGVIQPIVLRASGADGFELIAGERRYRASKIAGLKSIPAIVRKLSDQEVLAVSLIENIQRKDLNIIEEANGYKRLVEEFKLTHEDLSRITSRSRSHITNILRLLKLHPEVQNMLIHGRMDMGHARALLPLEESLQVELAKVIIDKHLTTSEVEDRVARILNKHDLSATDYVDVAINNPEIQRLEAKMTKKLGLKAKIKPGSGESGKVLLSYNSLDQLNKLLKLF